MRRIVAGLVISVDAEDVFPLIAPTSTGHVVRLGALLVILLLAFVFLPLAAFIVIAATVIILPALVKIIFDVAIYFGAYTGLYRMLVDWTIMPNRALPTYFLVFPSKTIH